MEELANRGIVHGIDEIDIQEMVKSRVYDTPICVARADLPKRGQNGTVNFHFDKDRKPKPYRDFPTDISRSDFIVTVSSTVKHPVP